MQKSEKSSVLADRREKFRKANLSDDVLFALAMQNTEFCAAVLSIVMDKEIVGVEYVETQKSILNAAGFKSVRLDVYAVDKDGKIYSVEMQAVNNDSMPKRARFYQGMLDLSSLQSGRAAKYRDLAEQYVVFITEFDIFGEGLYKYTFRNRCEEAAGLLLGDATTKIFLNTMGTVRTDETDMLIRFLHFVHETTEAAVQGDERIRQLYEMVRALKGDKEKEADYVSLEGIIADRVEAAEAIAEARGEARGRIRRFRSVPA